MTSLRQTHGSSAPSIAFPVRVPWRLGGLLGVLVLLGGALSAPHAAGRVALVIGNGAYAVQPLRNPAHDAADMRAALHRLGFEVIHKRDAGLRTLQEADSTGLSGAASILSLEA